VPRGVIVVDSPMAAQIAANLLSRDQVAQVAQVRAQVGDQVAQVAQVRAQVYDQVGDQVGAQVRAQVDDQVREQVRAQVYDQVGDQVGAQVYYEQSWATSLIGWCSLAAWCDYYDRACGITNEVARTMIAYMRCRPSYTIATRDWLIVSRSPVVKRDAEHRLHCEDGPAVRYTDGWSIYAWHGTRIPAEWITHRATLTAATALTHENLEQRLAACQILGWEKILSELDARTIDTDHPRIGTLVEVDLPGAGTERFLRVQCGTGRTFALWVDGSVKTAYAANLSTVPQLKSLGLTKKQIRKAMIEKRT
jgi:hypothetical protein